MSSRPRSIDLCVRHKLCHKPHIFGPQLRYCSGILINHRPTPGTQCSYLFLPTTACFLPQLTALPQFFLTQNITSPHLLSNERLRPTRPPKRRLNHLPRLDLIKPYLVLPAHRTNICTNIIPFGPDVIPPRLLRPRRVRGFRGVRGEEFIDAEVGAGVVNVQLVGSIGVCGSETRERVLGSDEGGGDG
jgi:hypothetical protein